MLSFRDKEGKNMNRLSVILCLGILISGCLETVAPNPKGFEWENPKNKDIFYAADLGEGATEIKLTYTSPLTYEPDIDFNSHDVAKCFDFGATEAVADLYCFRDFYKQGENRFQVNHDNFGTSVFFDIESAGPSFAIREVCYEKSTQCENNPSSEMVDVLIEYRDPSGISLATLNGIDAYQSPTALSKRFLVSTSDTYTFITEDTLGTSSTITYKSDGQEINEIMEVRIDETFLGNIKDVLSEGISGIYLPAGDEGLEGLQNLDGGGGLICSVSVKELRLGKIDINDIGISDSNSDPQLTTDIVIEPANDYVFDDGSVDDFDDVGVEVLVDTRIRILGCGRVFGIPTYLSLNGLRLFIETLQVNSDVDVNIINERFNLTLNDSSNGDAIVYFDSGLSDDNPDLNGFVDFFLGLGFVRDLILGIIQNVINENLEEIVIADEIETDNGTSLSIELQPTSLYFINNQDNIGDMFIKLKGMVSTTVADSKVKPALGSYYVNDLPSLPVVPDNGSSLAVTVNSNLINQGLLAAYNIGATHITVMDEEVFLGTDATDSLGDEGDIRVELYPSSPGQFFLEGVDVNKAYLEYNGAVLTISIKDNNEWRELFLADVDIKAGVILSVRDSKLYMTIAETPTFSIRRITDLKAKRKVVTPFGTFYFAIKLSGVLIESLVREAILFGIPYVAESELKIDISKLNLPAKLTTEKLTTEGGHLGFDIGVNE
jgi:hypothetical protein